MLLATSFLSHDWLARILQKRKLEGLHTTRPWALINIAESEEVYSLGTKIFIEDLYLEVAIKELPSVLNKSNEDSIMQQIATFMQQAYKAPIPYWLIVSCPTGTNRSTAISKWASDTYLIPIEALYSGHNVNTISLSRKIYNILEDLKN